MDHNNTGTLSLIQELALDDFRRKSWPVANIYLIFSAVIPLALVYGSFVGLLTAGIIALVIVLVNTYSEFRDKVASCVAALGRSISGVFGTGRFATVMTSKRSKVALQNSKNRFGTEEQQQPYLRKSPAATTEGQSMGDGPLEDIGEDNNNMEDDISSLEDEFKGLPREDPIRRLTRAFKKKLEEQKEELKTKLQKVEAGVESCSEKVDIAREKDVDEKAIIVESLNGIVAEQADIGERVRYLEAVEVKRSNTIHVRSPPVCEASRDWGGESPKSGSESEDDW